MMPGVPEWAIWTVRSVAVVWLVSAACTSLYMQRRGHDAQLWAVIGLIAGPFALAAATVSARRAAARPALVLSPGTESSGARDVAVVVDTAAPVVAGNVLRKAVDVRRAVLLAVVSRDTLDEAAHRGELRSATTALEKASVIARGDGRNPAVVIVAGHPERAAIAYAKSEGLELLEATS